jgi:uncharacterized protein (TIGR04168 family)
MLIETAKVVRIAIVGDVHDQWSANDAVTLHALGVDLVLFVGDFGNEAVEVVQLVSQLDLPKAVILGNHDAWYSASGWGKQRCPYDRTQEDWVQQQIDRLGDDFVGYGSRDFPALNLSVVGARPFSWGGDQWKYSRFYRDRFNVHSFAESTQRIVQAFQSAAFSTVLTIGHNGPLGLGSAPEDPCGKDWDLPPLMDYGDPDWQAAIIQAQTFKSVALVTFGHMHHRLRRRPDDRRTHHCDALGTVYLNAACVPRVRELAGETVRHFALVTLDAGLVSRATQAWVNQSGAVVAETVLIDRMLGHCARDDRQTEQIE